MYLAALTLCLVANAASGFIINPLAAAVQARFAHQRMAHAGLFNAHMRQSQSGALNAAEAQNNAASMHAANVAKKATALSHHYASKAKNIGQMALNLRQQALAGSQVGSNGHYGGLAGQNIRQQPDASLRPGETLVVPVNNMQVLNNAGSQVGSNGYYGGLAGQNIRQQPDIILKPGQTLDVPVNNNMQVLRPGETLVVPVNNMQVLNNAQYDPVYEPVYNNNFGAAVDVNQGFFQNSPVPSLSGSGRQGNLLGGARQSTQLTKSFTNRAASNTMQYNEPAQQGVNFQPLSTQSNNGAASYQQNSVSQQQYSSPTTQIYQPEINIEASTILQGVNNNNIQQSNQISNQNNQQLTGISNSNQINNQGSQYIGSVSTNNQVGNQGGQYTSTVGSNNQVGNQGAQYTGTVTSTSQTGNQGPKYAVTNNNQIGTQNAQFIDPLANNQGQYIDPVSAGSVGGQYIDPLGNNQLSNPSGQVASTISQSGQYVDTFANQGGQYVDTLANQGGQYVDPLANQGGQYVDPLTNQGGQYVDPLANQGGQYVDPLANQGGQYVDPLANQGGTYVGNTARQQFVEVVPTNPNTGFVDPLSGSQGGQYANTLGSQVLQNPVSTSSMSGTYVDPASGTATNINDPYGASAAAAASQLSAAATEAISQISGGNYQSLNAAGQTGITYEPISTNAGASGTLELIPTGNSGFGLVDQYSAGAGATGGYVDPIVTAGTNTAGGYLTV